MHLCSQTLPKHCGINSLKVRRERGRGQRHVSACGSGADGWGETTSDGYCRMRQFSRINLASPMQHPSRWSSHRYGAALILVLSLQLAVLTQGHGGHEWGILLRVRPRTSCQQQWKKTKKMRRERATKNVDIRPRPSLKWREEKTENTPGCCSVGIKTVKAGFLAGHNRIILLLASILVYPAVGLS